MLEKEFNSKEDDDDDFDGDLEAGLNEDEAGSSSSWLALFNYTSRQHTLSLTIALIFSIASGVIAPALTLFLGKVFDQFSDYGSGKIQSSTIVHNVGKYSVYLCGLGIASGVFNGAFYAGWLAFGELQAKAAREELFKSLLAKEMEWFDMREMGVETLVSRLQR